MNYKGILIILIIIVNLVFSIYVKSVNAYSESENDYKTYIKKGMQNEEKGNIEKAFNYYNKAVKIAPNKTEAYMRRGSTYFKKKEFDKAILDASKAIEIGTVYLRAWLGKELIKGMTGKQESKEDDLNEKANELNFVANAYIIRGCSYECKQDYKQALDNYNKAIETKPKFYEAYMARGRFYFFINYLDGALLEFNKAIEIDPKRAEAYNARGVIYQHKCDLISALNDCMKAININPSMAEAYYNRGNLLYILNYTQKAILDYDKAIEINFRYAEAYFARGIAYYNKHDLTIAIADYNIAVAINPLIEKEAMIDKQKDSKEEIMKKAKTYFDKAMGVKLAPYNENKKNSNK